MRRGYVVGWTRGFPLRVLTLLSRVEMYPVLVATGGLTTFLWDFRHRLLTRVRPRRRRASSISPGTSASIELQPVPSTTPVDVAVPPLARTREVNRAEEEEGKSGKDTLETGLRQRNVVLPVSPTPRADAPADERLRTRLIVPPTRVAYTLGATFITMVVMLVVLRGKYPVKPVPRALDFTTNMVIAGVIIFGVCPVCAVASEG